MTAFIALLRAVNVGGTGKLPMNELVAMCEGLGYGAVKTWIASGNVVFTSDHTEARVKADLEACLEAWAGKPVGIMVRTADQMHAVLKANPFPDAAPNRTVAIFLDAAPASDCLDAVKGRKAEEIQLGVREIYVHYGAGMGNSKLVIPAAKAGTARNMNTIAKLAEMVAALG
ncbi:DUF1697 domain-containing protein [uncultured Maricaulis sp.]|uniref:DUF1697 domain-containing protein n=1 Tax=uncultured Maricaulis sp. TaxID=174710 RepID=UPI0030D93D50|tara:strand:+ start:27445 stop:27960 length:516 start_codon:yes stop_codon:yes gene_type:complete